MHTHTHTYRTRAKQLIEFKVTAVHGHISWLSASGIYFVETQCGFREQLGTAENKVGQDVEAVLATDMKEVG